MPSTIKLIIIEDNENDQLLYERIIKKGFDFDVQITTFETGTEGLEYIVDNHVHCILLDYKLPDMSGLEVLERLNSGETPSPPVIMLTGMGSEDIAAEALKFGAYDYLSKSNLEPTALIKAISNGAEKSTLTKTLEAKSEKLTKISQFDPLTGLPNRAKFEGLLNQLIESSIDTHAAVFMLDLDRFKEINETKGHTYGDMLLKGVAEVLESITTMDKFLARLGGDEFAILIMTNDEEDIAILAETLLKKLSQPIQVDKENVELISASIGIAVTPYAGDTASQLMSNADMALANAKEAGKNTYSIFSKEMSVVLSKRIEMEAALKKAIQNNELFLVYHPIYYIKDSSIYALEVLTRWQNKTLGMVPPDTFIPLAEELGLINQIGDWITNTALNQLATWHNTFSKALKITINISPVQIKTDGWADAFQEKLKKFNIPASSVIIELTETAIVSDLIHTKNVLTKLSNLGCIILLDDFGTGFSSLSLLRQLPIAGLKIDKSFVQELDENMDDAQLIESIVAFSDVLKLIVVAEGVEKKEQLEFLKKISNHNLMQGYFLSLPLKANEMEGLLSKNKTLE